MVPLQFFYKDGFDIKSPATIDMILTEPNWKYELAEKQKWSEFESHGKFILMFIYF